MLEFFQNYGVFLNLFVILFSDVVLWFRSKSKKTSQQQFEDLKKNVEELVKVLRGDQKNG